MRINYVRTRSRGISIAAVGWLLGRSWIFPAVAAATMHTDVNNVTGTEDGTGLHPFATIQAALDAAASGDTVKVAQGVYAENIVVNAKQIELRGGYAGGSRAGYAGGTSGEFSVQNPLANLTHIQGANHTATVLLQYTEASGSVVNGFKITGGSHGLELDTKVTWPHLANVAITDNSIERNGVPDYEHRGGGLLLSGSGHVVQGNTIRNNVSGRGAGVALSGDNITFTRNLVEGNVGYSDHAGGINQTGTALIAENLIRNNRTGEGLGYGWGGGILVLGTAVLRHNVFTGNHAPSIGGGVFVDDGGTAVLDHELIYANSADRGAAVYVDGYAETGSHADLIHCTIADNAANLDSAGRAVFVERYSSVTLLNTIVWGNGGLDFFADPTSSVTASYTLSEGLHTGVGNLMADPRFADSAQHDYHLRSTAGRFDPSAGGGAGAWLFDLENSPALDAAEPSSDYAAEPVPNGSRANLGAYGNTPQASKSAASAPFLSIQAVGNGIVISWAQSAGDWVLLFATSLASPVTWTDAQVVPSVVDGFFTVTRVASEHTEFYRLKR